MNEDNNCVIIITFKEFLNRADILPQKYILPQNFETLDNDILGIADWNHCFRPVKLSEEASALFYKKEKI